MLKYARPESQETLSQRYEDQARIQRALVIELRKISDLLQKLKEAFCLPLADENFTTLLRAERLDRVPSLLVTRSGGIIEENRKCESKNRAEGADRLLASKKVSPTARYELLRMVPARQEEAARLMIASGCFISPYVRALVGACDKSLMVNPKSRPRTLVIRQPQRDAANREISGLAAELKDLSRIGGADLIALFVSVRYAHRLLGNTRVRRYLRKHWPQVETGLNDIIKSYSDQPAI